MTSAGLQPRPPAEVLAQLLAFVRATNPGYTANLPGSLIEDISSTDTAAIVLIDQARVELVNSLTPAGVNAFLLRQLGTVYGVPLGQASNTSVYLIFTGPPGFVIAKGFTVSDGTYQYVVQDGGIVGADGETPQLYALATQNGTWAVPAGTVTQLVTSVPNPVVLTVVNPNEGLPGTNTETETNYRARVMQAGLAASQGMSRYLKTLLNNVVGVQTRLISVKEAIGGDWIVIVGGGDPYQVAYAIFMALFDIADLVGSTLTIAGISSANPGVVTTFLNHGYAPGQNITIEGCDPADYDGSYAVIATPTEKTFTLGKRYGANNVTGAAWLTGTATVTTDTAHGVTVGSIVVFNGIVPNAYNGTYTVTGVPNPDEIEFAKTPDPGSYVSGGQLAAGIANFDTAGLPAWVIGGVLTPNLRNQVVTITDWPDQYPINFVNPPQQTVAVNILWNTTSPNFVAPAAVAQLGGPAIVDYVNSVAVGQPMNLFEMQCVFQDAISSVLQPALLTRLVIDVSINGVSTPPDVGTGIIEGDPESYFYAVISDVDIAQG